MADYVPYTWEDRVVEKPRTYTIQENEDGTVTLIPEPGTIYNEGTKVTAARMNQIEQGIAGSLPKSGGEIFGDYQINTATAPWLHGLRIGDGTGWRYPFKRWDNTRIAYMDDSGELFLTPSFHKAWHTGNDTPIQKQREEAPTDWNNATTPGMYYYLETSKYTNTPPGLPGWGVLEVLSTSPVNYVVQRVRSVIGGQTYERIRDSTGVWSTWGVIGGMAPVGRLRRAQVNAQMNSWTTILDISGANGRLEYLRDVYTGSAYTMQYRLTIDGVVDTVSFGSATVHYYLGQPTDGDAFDEVRASDPIIFSNSLKIETLASTSSPVEVVAEYRLRPGAP